MKNRSTRRLSTISMLAVLAVAGRAAALEIRPIFTTGPFPGLSRELTGPEVGDGANPCSELDLSPPVTNEKASFCLAIREWQRHLRDAVTIEVEAYALEAPFFNFLGVASSPVFWLLGPSSNPVESDLGYNAVLHLLQVDNAHEEEAESIVHHLPRRKQLATKLPLDVPEEFRPISIAVTSAQFKALGANPPGGFSIGTAATEFATLADLDGVVVINTGRRPFDLDPRDGVGIGPLTLETWDEFDTNDPMTIPSDFFPEIFDFVGLAAHELGHVLGFESAVDRLNTEFSEIPRDEQFLWALDLYRIEESAVGSISEANDFHRAIRNLRSEGVGQSAPELGNHVFVHSASGLDGSESVPLASGVLGDGSQAAHLRSSIIRIRDQNADLVTGEWIEDRERLCPPEAGFPDEARCPYGTLMKPISMPHTPAIITAADLVVLDLTGWDVEYSGGLDPAGSSGYAALVNLERLAAELGLELQGTVVTVED